MPAPTKPEEQTRRRAIGELVRRHRHHHGWTQQELCGAIAEAGLFLSPKEVCKIELGQHPVHADLLPKLEDALKIVRGGITNEARTTPACSRVVGLISHRPVREKDALVAKEEIRRKAHEAHKLASAAKVLPLYHRPINFPSSGLMDQPAVETAAERVRGKWGLGDGPVANLTYVLERHAIVVGFSETSVKTPVVFAGHVEGRPVLLWSGQLPGTAAENAEYRVALLETYFLALAVRVGQARGIARKNAEKLARAVLLPPVAITAALGAGRNKVTATNVAALAGIFILPDNLVLTRLEEVGKIDRSRRDCIQRCMSGRDRQTLPTLERPTWTELVPDGF